MKSRIPFKTIATSITSMVLGILIGWFSSTRIFPPNEDLTRHIASEHLMHATLLRQGKSEEVLSLLESTFPATVLWYDAFKYTAPDDIRTLWRIRDYKEQFDLVFPDRESIFLSNLPARPPSICSIKDVNAEQDAAANP